MTDPGEPAAIEQEIDFSKFDVMGDDVIALFNGLADKPPVHWSDTNQIWIAGQHAPVVEGFSGKLPLSAERHLIALAVFPENERAAKTGNIQKYFPHFLTNVEPPEHSRLRKLLMAAFSKKVAEGYREVVRAIVRRTIDDLADKTHIDFVNDYARPITVGAILHVMGLEADFFGDAERWARALNEGLAGTPYPDRIEKADAAIAEMAARFLPIIKARRDSESPKRDFLGELMLTGEDDDRLTDEEVAAQLMLVLVAGHDTTLNTMSLVVAKLAGQNDLVDYMRDNLPKFEPCITELMRIVNMSTLMSRIVTEDFSWHGADLKQGQVVFLMIAAANRDPRVFPNPDHIDFNRDQTKNMTFAPGRHFCIGHWFAKMMMSEALPAFIARYQRWELADGKPSFSSSIGFRGLTTLPLKLYSAPALQCADGWMSLSALRAIGAIQASQVFADQRSIVSKRDMHAKTLETDVLTEADDLKLMDGALFAQGCPHALFKTMRDEDPIRWTRGKFGRDYWSVTRHADVQAVLGDAKRFSSQRWGVSLPTSPEMVDPKQSEHARLAQAGAMLPTLDPPRHTAARAGFSARFTPKAVAQLEAQVRINAADILDTIDRSGDVDFVLDVAAKLPTSMIFTIMDIPREDWPTLFHYTNMHTCPEEPEFSIGTPLETRQKGVQGSIDYCRKLALKRRNGDGDDLITQIAQIEIEGQRLSDDELGFLGHMFIVGGQETTRSSLSAGVHQLAEDPTQYARLRQDRTLLKTLPDEFIRWATPVAHLMRTATCDVEMHGKTIKEGDWVVAWMASANRDERAFKDPDVFDIGRRGNAHVSFGYGPHFCLGAWLSRLQIRTILELIVERFPTLELRGEPELVASIQFCGMKHLPFGLRSAA